MPPNIDAGGGGGRGGRVRDGQAEADNAVDAVEVCSRHKRNSALTLRSWHLTRRVAVSDTAELGEGEILAQLQHVLALEPLRTHKRHFPAQYGCGMQRKLDGHLEVRVVGVAQKNAWFFMGTNVLLLWGT